MLPGKAKASTLSSFCSKRARTKARPALTHVTTSTCICDVYNPRCAAHVARGSDKFGSLCKCCFFFFSYSWGTYCYSGFYMTSVEWSGSCETVEGGSELETVNTRITERQEHQEKVSYFPGSCPSCMDLSGEFGGHTPFGPTHTHGTRICILTTFPVICVHVHVCEAAA